MLAFHYIISQIIPDTQIKLFIPAFSQDFPRDRVWSVMADFISSLTGRVTTSIFRLYILYLSYQYIRKQILQNSLIKRFRCKALNKYPQRDAVFGLDIVWEVAAAIKFHSYLDRIQRLYAENRKTFSSSTLGYTFIHTIEPVNLRTVLSTNFKDYAISFGRKMAFQPLIGSNITRKISSTLYLGISRLLIWRSCSSSWLQI